MPSSIYFGHNGKCAANFRSDELNMDAPKELLGLDVLHKRSTQRNVEAMPHGRFNTAPRTFFGQTAVDRSNYSVPSRLFLDPYHVSDGNLFSENFLMGRYQRGGQTSLAGRSSMLKMQPERFGKEDMQSRARSKYIEPEGGRFVPALKPACSRDKGPDPYGTHKHMSWVIKNTGCAHARAPGGATSARDHRARAHPPPTHHHSTHPTPRALGTFTQLTLAPPSRPFPRNRSYSGGMGSLSKTSPQWNTSALTRPSVSQ
jgi:hypothetical protein